MTDKEMMEHLLNGGMVTSRDKFDYSYYKIGEEGDVLLIDILNESNYRKAYIPRGRDVKVYDPIIKKKLSWEEIEDAISCFVNEVENSGGGFTFTVLKRELKRILGF